MLKSNHEYNYEPPSPMRKTILGILAIIVALLITPYMLTIVLPILERADIFWSGFFETN